MIVGAGLQRGRIFRKGVAVGKHLVEQRLAVCDDAGDGRGP